MQLWILTLLVGVITYFLYGSYKKYQYWRKRGVPAPMSPLLGGFLEMAWVGQCVFDLKWTRKLGRVFGIFEGSVPVLFISDTEMLKHVMVKDFSHFVNHRSLPDINGPILDQNVSALRDQRWKEVRSILVPTFTSGKMRHMNDLINECCENMISNMEKLATSGEEFEAKELYGRVTLDVIASTFFATKIDSQNDPNNPFVRHVKKAFDFSFGNPLVIIAFLFPKLVPLAMKLGLEGMPKESVDFFVSRMDEIVKMRTSSKQDRSRRDFLQLMLNSLKGQEKSADAAHSTTTRVRDDVGHSQDSSELDIVSNVISEGDTNAPPSQTHGDYKLTTEELTAQAIIFFLAGYETTATTLGFLTYCLTVNPEIQERLREEIEQVMGDSNEPDYDRIAQMTYLDMCVNETLRLFPPVPRADRECNEDWEYNGLKIDKGTVIAIPVFAMHRDPEFWPDPEIYDPERFSYENKKNIKPYSFQTFGQGPRNCIGMRFAFYEIKMVMVAILRKFRFVHSERTQVPLQLKNAGFVGAKDGIWLKIEKL